MNKKAEILIPKRLQLETFYGCNARCIMCAVSLPPTRKVGEMPVEMSKYILDEFAPYVDKIEKVDFFGLGEPMLDKHIFERIEYAKKLGYQSVAISTNAELLNEEKQKRLLDSGVDCVIFSIDGFKKETHEAIRKKLNFEKVVENCESTIRLRDKGGYDTKFVVRFIRQESNKSEWEDYRKFWGGKLTTQKKDLMIVYDVNTMGGEVYLTKQDIVDELDPEIERMPCNMVFHRFIVLNNGLVPLCCEDTPKAEQCLGDVNENSPLEIFNGERFNEVRRIHLAGKKNDIGICKGCTVLYSERNQVILNDHNNINSEFIKQGKANV